MNYSIGQLADLVGVPTSTLRFYERIGLLKADFRTGGNYRGYKAPTLERLRFIRSAQATGLNLEDIQTLLNLTQATEQPCDEVTDLMKRRLEEIRQRIKDLRKVERVLAKSLEGCCKGDGPDICQDVCRLNGTNPAVCKPTKRIPRSPA